MRYVPKHDSYLRADIHHSKGVSDEVRCGDAGTCRSKGWFLSHVPDQTGRVGVAGGNVSSEGTKVSRLGWCVHIYNCDAPRWYCSNEEEESLETWNVT
jgi:hypothetical protein